MCRSVGPDETALLSSDALQSVTHDSADKRLHVSEFAAERAPSRKTKRFKRASRCKYWHSDCCSGDDRSEEKMRSGASNSKTISFDRNDFRAAKCEKCGTKIYPAALLDAHVMRHEQRDRWFNDELRKLRHTFSHMRDLA